MRATIVVPTIRAESPTLETLAGFDLPDVEVIEQRDRRSLNHARNAGVRDASSDRILILDDDLTFDKEWLHNRLEQASRSAAERTVWGAKGTGILTQVDWTGTGFRPILGRVLVFDREAWRVAGGFPGGLHHGGDTVFVLRAAQAGWRIHQLPHEFRHHDDVDEYSTVENARWLWTLFRYAPQLIGPRLPGIFRASIRGGVGD